MNSFLDLIIFTCTISEREKMKKALLFFSALIMLCSVSWGTNCEINQKNNLSDNYGCKNNCQTTNKEDNCKNLQDKQENCQKDKSPCCDEEIDDDEYFTYNQCFFDKRFRKMKRILCLTSRQEKCADTLYHTFKLDMEKLHEKYQKERDCLLKVYECCCGSDKEHKSNLKEIKKETKERCKEFREDIKELLCKNQLKDFRKFQRCEKRKMKKIAKYSKIYKFPCIDCSKK